MSASKPPNVSARHDNIHENGIRGFCFRQLTVCPWGISATEKLCVSAISRHNIADGTLAPIYSKPAGAAHLQYTFFYRMAHLRKRTPRLFYGMLVQTSKTSRPGCRRTRIPEPFSSLVTQYIRQHSGETSSIEHRVITHTHEACTR